MEYKQELEKLESETKLKISRIETEMSNLKNDNNILKAQVTNPSISSKELKSLSDAIFKNSKQIKAAEGKIKTIKTHFEKKKELIRLNSL